MRGQAIHGHLVEHDERNVKVDGVPVHSDEDYKRALGLDTNKKYPHPAGWTEDWATLNWLRAN